MQNRVYVIYICMYVWMVRMPFKRARGKLFSKKHGFLGLTPVYSETTALSKPYYFPAKTLAFQETKS